MNQAGPLSLSTLFSIDMLLYQGLVSTHKPEFSYCTFPYLFIENKIISKDKQAMVNLERGSENQKIKGPPYSVFSAVLNYFIYLPQTKARKEKSHIIFVA